MIHDKHCPYTLNKFCNKKSRNFSKQSVALFQAKYGEDKKKLKKNDRKKVV